MFNLKPIGRIVGRCIALVAIGAALVHTAELAVADTDPAQDRLQTSNVAAAAAANAQFYAALNAMFNGEGQPMQDIWSHAEDIRYMGPDGGYAIGWSAVGPEWDKQTAAKLGGRVTPQRISIVAGADLAIVNCIESGENVVDGKTETVNLRATNVFRKEGDVWKMIGHQTDLLGYMTRPE